MHNEFSLFKMAMEAFVDFVFDESVPERVRNLRGESAIRLLPIVLEYNRQGFKYSLVEAVLRKKIEFIREARTKAEMEEILSLPRPHYNYAEIVPSSKYSVEEEELILWFMVISNCQLKDIAYDRINYLFKKLLPEEYKDVCSLWDENREQE